MRLLFKFNLIFLMIFVAGVVGAGKVSYDLLQSNAKEEVLNHARLTMEKAIGGTLLHQRPDRPPARNAAEVHLPAPDDTGLFRHRSAGDARQDLP